MSIHHYIRLLSNLTTSYVRWSVDAIHIAIRCQTHKCMEIIVLFNVSVKLVMLPCRLWVLSDVFVYLFTFGIMYGYNPLQ